MLSFMKKIILVMSIIYICFYGVQLSNSISESNQMKELANKMRYSGSLEQNEKVVFENYVKRMVSIKIRGSSLGAKLLAPECCITDYLLKNAVGETMFKVLCETVNVNTNKF